MTQWYAYPFKEKEFDHRHQICSTVLSALSFGHKKMELH